MAILRYRSTCNTLFQRSLVLICLLVSIGAAAQTEGNEVFGVDQILQVDVVFASDNFWNELEAEYDGDQEYVEAQVSLSGVNGTEVIDQVGIRLKGNSSMFHPGDKKSFKIDFNEYRPRPSVRRFEKVEF